MLIIFINYRSFLAELFDKPHPGNSISAVKITLDEAGMYEISSANLNSYGFDNLENLHLYSMGVEIPYWLDLNEDGKVIRFYAEDSRNSYTENTIYWLTKNTQNIWPPQERDFPLSSRPSVLDLQYFNGKLPPVGSYIETLQAEENNVYQPQVEGDHDHWLWEMIAGGQTGDYELELSELISGSATIVIDTWSSTEASIEPDHHLRIAVNSELIADEFWEGRGEHRIIAEVGPGRLRGGINHISIEAPGDLDVLADLYYLDRIIVKYPRKPVPYQNQLELNSATGEQELSQFEGPVSIYNVTDSNQPQRIWFEIPNDETFVGSNDQRYVVVGSLGYKKPARIESYEMNKHLFEMDNGAEYVVIGSSELLMPINPLIDFRRNQGLHTLTVSVEDVYDQFGYGYPDPNAIASFISHAYDTWKTPPKYLLLIGDASYDPLGYISSSNVNRLPTYFIQTIYGGETSSDIEFAQVNEDLWPDLAVGRIPAQEPEQVKIIVEKILAYEERKSIPDTLRVVAVADGQDASFKNDALEFLDRFSAIYEKELFAPEPGISDANVRIKEYFNEGNTILAYFGHGSINMWGKDKLFTIEDARAKMGGGPLPLIINMTCLTGLFTHPKVESLAETLLWNKDGGAIAVLAPSSLTLPIDQSYMSSALADALSDAKFETIGESHLYALRQVPLDHKGSIDVMQTFMLFGDPALTLPSLTN